MQTVPTHRDVGGRYEVKLAAPGRWELLRSGTVHSEHRTASVARNAAERLERLRVLRSSLSRSALVLLVVLVGIGIAVGFRTVPNPDRAPAVAFVARLEAAYQSVVTNAGDLTDFSLESDGFVGATVDGPPVFELETGKPDAEPTAPRQISVLMGEQSGTCYVLRWEEPAWPLTGLLNPRLDCTPASRPGLNSSFAQRASSTQRGVVYWTPLLPVERIQAGWFFPVLLVLLGTGLWTSVGMTLATLRFRSGGTVSIRWES